MRQDSALPSPQSIELTRQLSEVEPFLCGLATKLCHDRDDAADLVQDTFERALRRAGQLTSASNLRSWLATIMHNLFIDRCRARQRRPAMALVDDIAVSEPEPASPSRWAVISPQQLWAAVEQLDLTFREVYRLHAADRLSYEEIAAKLGIRKATVGTRLHRARRKLREALKQQAGASTEAAQ